MADQEQNSRKRTQSPNNQYDKHLTSEKNIKRSDEGPLDYSFKSAKFTGALDDDFVST